MDDKLLDQIAALDGAERMEFILENCFSLKADFGEALCDFPLVEIEENLCVLELESAKAFESFEKVATVRRGGSTCVGVYGPWR